MESGPARPASRPVASVARALALLDELGASPEGLGGKGLARRIGVNASTASRLLATLEAGRMVERAPGGPYRLGLRLVALADGVLSRLPPPAPPRAPAAGAPPGPGGSAAAGARRGPGRDGDAVGPGGRRGGDGRLRRRRVERDERRAARAPERRPCDRRG